MDFKENTDQIHMKCQQRLYLLRKLKSFDVCPEILETVYWSMILSSLEKASRYTCFFPTFFHVGRSYSKWNAYLFSYHFPCWTLIQSRTLNHFLIIFHVGRLFKCARLFDRLYKNLSPIDAHLPATYAIIVHNS